MTAKQADELIRFLRAIATKLGAEIQPRREPFAAVVEATRVARPRPEPPQPRDDGDRLPPSGGTPPAEFWRRKR